jgi:membrane protein required for colicin V production
VNEIDIAFLVVAIISCAIGVFRGAVRELIYLSGWVLAFLGAPLLGPVIAPIVLPELIADEAMRNVVAVGFAFLLILVVASGLAAIISSLVKSAGLSGLDRTFGAVYGLVRACVLMVLFTLLAGLTTLPRTELWQGSAVVPFARAAVLVLQPYLPEGFSKRLNYRLR